MFSNQLFFHLGRDVSLQGSCPRIGTLCWCCIWRMTWQASILLGRASSSCFLPGSRAWVLRQVVWELGTFVLVTEVRAFVQQHNLTVLSLLKFNLWFCFFVKKEEYFFKKFECPITIGYLFACLILFHSIVGTHVFNWKARPCFNSFLINKIFYFLWTWASLFLANLGLVYYQTENWVWGDK